MQSLKQDKAIAVIAAIVVPRAVAMISPLLTCASVTKLRVRGPIIEFTCKVEVDVDQQLHFILQERC